MPNDEKPTHVSTNGRPHAKNARLFVKGDSDDLRERAVPIFKACGIVGAGETADEERVDGRMRGAMGTGKGFRLAIELGLKQLGRMSKEDTARALAELVK